MLDSLQRDVLPRDVLQRTFEVYRANLRALSAYRPALGGDAHGLTLHLLRAAAANPHIRRYPGHAMVRPNPNPNPNANPNPDPNP